MRSSHIARSFGMVLLAATVASAQPQPQTQPQTQPLRPQPQDPTPVPDPRPQPAKPAAEPRQPSGSGRIGGGGDVVVTGCLRRGEGASADSKEQAGLAGGFVLKQATTAKPADAAKEASGTPSGQASAKEYRVIGSESIDLAQHVGHEVEVKGRVTLADRAPDAKSTDSSVSSSQPSGSTGVSTVPPATGTPPAPAAAVTLTVSSLKMISASCSSPAS